MKRTSFKKFPRVVMVDIDQNKPGLQSGLIATVDLKPGDHIFYADGTYVNLNITSKKDSAKYSNALGIKRNTWINPPDTNPLRFLNHSCNPNAGIKGERTIVARKKIKAGEHITIDYSITECDELWQLEVRCRCGEQTCRTHIRSIQSLPRATFTKYLPYIGRHMQTEYKKAHKL